MTAEEAVAVFRQVLRVEVWDYNVFYDFRTKTEATENAYLQLLYFIGCAVDGDLDAPELRTACYRYAQVIYDETYRLWRENKEAIRFEYERENGDILPIYDLKLYTKELDFINERWRTWCFRDNERTFIEFGNNGILEPSFAWLTDIDTSIRDVEYKLSFGKYRDKSLKWILAVDPRYLHWVHTNEIKGIKFCAEIWKEIEQWSEVLSRKRV